MLKRTRHAATRLAGLAIGIGLLHLPSVQAQSGPYPNRAIDIIVAFAPGGSSDSTARLIAPYLAKKWGQPVNVVNQPGGSGIPGTHHVMRAKADGYTILLDAHSNNSMLGAARSDLPFKWDARTPIGRLYLEPVVYAVKSDAPWATLKDLLAAVKADPKSFKWGAGGVGSIGMFSTMELFAQSGIDVGATNRVIFAGGGPTVTAVAGGHVALAGHQLSEVLPLSSGGLLKGLAVVTPERVPQMPQVPTAKEAGFPALQVSGWTAISGPPDLPKDIVDKWDAAFREMMADADMSKKAEQLGKIPAHLGPVAFHKYMHDQFELYRKLAEAAGVRK
jgi:tripartite-type tricarboxylate transporter receptor subunit TctC